MNESQIKDGLRELVLPEPALGFDPDDVAVRAAKRQLTRRASIATGAGTLVVVGVVSALLATGPGSAAPATMPEDINTQIERNKRHLEEVLPTLVTGGRDITLESISQPYPGDENGWDSMVAVIAFHDQEGPTFFNIAINGPKTTANKVSELEGACRAEPTTDVVKPPGLVQEQQCERVPQPDGSTVVTQETGPVAVPGSGNTPKPPKMLTATHYRLDGTSVNYFSMTMVRGGGETRENFPLAKEKAISLITDTALYIR